MPDQQQVEIDLLKASLNIAKAQNKAYSQEVERQQAQIDALQGLIHDQRVELSTLSAAYWRTASLRELAPRENEVPVRRTVPILDHEFLQEAYKTQLQIVEELKEEIERLREGQ